MTQADDDRECAERYRYLREHAWKASADGGWTGHFLLPDIPAYDHTPYSAKLDKAFSHDTLDEAVDAMRKGLTRSK